jgi:hypothetical protein
VLRGLGELEHAIASVQALVLLLADPRDSLVPLDTVRRIALAPPDARLQFIDGALHGYWESYPAAAPSPCRWPGSPGAMSSACAPTGSAFRGWSPSASRRRSQALGPLGDAPDVGLAQGRQDHAAGGDAGQHQRARLVIKRTPPAYRASRSRRPRDLVLGVIR